MDGWEFHEAYWNLVADAANGVVLIWWECPEGGLDGFRAMLTPKLAAVLAHSHPTVRAAGLVGLAVGARTASARRMEA